MTDILYNITLTSHPTMPKDIDNRVLGREVPLMDMNRQWELDIEKKGHEDSMTVWIEVDPAGKQIGDTRFGVVEYDMDLNAEVCGILALFLNCQFEQITNILFENAKAQEAEARRQVALRDMEPKLGGSI